ncbi:MAG: cytochrome c3 family protein, partial [Myxococcota bacterium]
HRTMTQLATSSAVVGDFDDVELSWLAPPRNPGGERQLERYRLSESDGEYWVTALHPISGLPGRAARIVMTTGSHHHQILWIQNGDQGELVNLPFTYLIDQQRWVPRADSFLSPPDDPFGLVYWNEVCIECHSTAGRPRLRSGQPSDTQVTELGIACESCHGPAGPHIAANQSPLRRRLQREKADPTIVNPARLSASRSADVCGRCHSIISYRGTDLWEGHWNDFTPGDKLESHGRLVLRPESPRRVQRRAIAEHLRAEGPRFLRDRFWADGGVRVTGRELNDVVASPCFKGDKFSCLSCHSMHGYEDVSDQLASGMDGDAACLQCHAQFEEEPAAHTRHAVDSEASRCMNCHMPYTTYGLLKAIRSHRVSSPSVRAERRTGRPNACNACHLDQSLAWTQTYLEKDFGVQPLRLNDNERQLAAGPRWIATGDAGVRALAGWYMGWAPARAAAGDAWMAPYLAELLADQYAAVRAVASESLRTLPGFSDLDYDFVAAKGTEGVKARIRVQADWLSRSKGKAISIPGPLALGDPEIDRRAWQELMKERNMLPIALTE